MDYPRADLILKNATVWTVDSSLPRAEAVAIRGNEIIAVGQDAEMEPLIGSGTKVYDLERKLVLPGFNDCHYHLMEYTIMSATMLDLYRVYSLEEIQKRLQKKIGRAHV